jgi:hypothetical protein
MDLSHRGGRPGFVRVDGDVLTIPDFRCNRYFNMGKHGPRIVALTANAITSNRRNIWLLPSTATSPSR